LLPRITARPQRHKTPCKAPVAVEELTGGAREFFRLLAKACRKDAPALSRECTTSHARFYRSSRMGKARITMRRMSLPSTRALRSLKLQSTLTRATQNTAQISNMRATNTTKTELRSTWKLQSCRELLPVCCAESYSQSIVPRATPGAVVPRATPNLSCRELLQVGCAESYSRAVVPRATPELLCRELPVYLAESYSRLVVPRATPELLCRELLGSCCAESYFGSIVLILVLCYVIVFPAGHAASGMDFVCILIEKASKSALRPAEGRPVSGL
jgi:hypothetical protein